VSDLLHAIEFISRLIFVLGALFLVASILPSAGGIGEWVTSRAFATTPVATCAELNRGGRLPRRVAVRGRLGPTGDDVLTAPLSQKPCVWYQLKVLRSYRDGEGNETNETRWKHTSSDTVWLHDRTGAVGVSWKLFQRNVRGELFNGLIESPSLPDSARPAALEELGFVAHGKFTGTSDALSVSEQIIAPAEALSLVRFVLVPGMFLGTLGWYLHWLASLLMVRAL